MRGLSLEESRIFGMGTPRGGHEASTSTWPREGWLGVQRCRLRGRARKNGARGDRGLGREERREREDGRPRAINIPKYAGKPRTHIHMYVHVHAYARSCSRTPVRALSIYTFTYANCKYNLSEILYSRWRAYDARERIVDATIARALAHSVYYMPINITFEFRFEFLLYR